MENCTLAKVGAAFGEQSWETNASESNSFRLFNPVKLPLDGGSLPQVWQETSHFSHCTSQNDVASSSDARSYPQFAIDHIPSLQDVTQKVHNPIPQPPRKSPINAVGATSAGLCTNFNPDTDPKKLRRMMSNRESARRSRLRRIKQITDLECKAEKLEDQIASLHTQIETYTNQKNLLIQEQSSLKQEMDYREKENKLEEAELEKNKAEVHKLRELHRKQEEEFQARARMLTRDYQQLMFTSNPNYSGGEPIGCTKTNQGVKHAEEASMLEVDISKQQDMLPGWETGQSLTTDSDMQIFELHERNVWNTSQLHRMINPNDNAVEYDLYSHFK